MHPKKNRCFSASLRVTILAVTGLVSSATALADQRPFIQSFNAISLVASTVPANGDQNPYGVFVIPKSIGALNRGNILVSNFNNATTDTGGNLQGTGTTIVQVSPDGEVSLFAEIDPVALGASCPGGVGLTTALVVLQRGWVIVGSLPTTDGSSATAMPGCLIVLDANGKVVETFAGDGINGPWDMTAQDKEGTATLFVTNVLNGNVLKPPMDHVEPAGTVLRIALSVPKLGQGMPTITSTTEIGSTFSEQADPAALIIGPTGVGLAPDGTLYVADTVNSRIAAIPDALTRTTSALTGVDVSSAGSLMGPLGLVIAPNGNIVTANAGDGNLVETTPQGLQVAAVTAAPAGGGSLFGLAIALDKKSLFFVDDSANTLNALVSE